MNSTRSKKLCMTTVLAYQFAISLFRFYNLQKYLMNAIQVNYGTIFCCRLLNALEYVIYSSVI